MALLRTPQECPVRHDSKENHCLATSAPSRKVVGGASRTGELRDAPRRRGSDGRKQHRVRESVTGLQGVPGSPIFYPIQGRVNNDDFPANQDERPLSLGVARLLPELFVDATPPALPTIHAWATRGCGGVVLETWC